MDYTMGVKFTWVQEFEGLVLEQLAKVGSTLEASYKPRFPESKKFE